MVNGFIKERSIEKDMLVFEVSWSRSNEPIVPVLRKTYYIEYRVRFSNTAELAALAAS